MDMIKFHDKVCLVGQKREDVDKQKALTKPTQLASFILAYSRRIMLNYMKQLNPYFDISIYKTSSN
jgi:hypothetical protein